MKIALAGIMPLTLAACATMQMPEKTYIPVPIPCEVEQVEKTELPTPTGYENLFGLAKIALAQIGLLKAENERLRAANNNPCPTEIEQ